MNKQQSTENKMGVIPIPKLLVTMSLPMVVAMLVQALYNIVDSIFVSRFSDDAFTAVSLAFPVQNLMIAVAAGTGVGINALLSKSLGEKNKEMVDKSARNGLFLALVSYIVFALLGFFFSRIYFSMQTDIVAVIDSGFDYLFIISVFSMGIFFEITFERLLQSTGKTFYTMITQGVGAIINIVLDPIFIFGYFGLPAMGTKGAAIATVIGQIIAMLLGIYFNHAKNHEISISFRRFRPCGRTIASIYKVGFPSIVMQSIGSVMTYGMNKILLAFTATAVNVFGAYFKIQSFIFMPIFGLNNAMVPIIAYNYGAGKRKRIISTIKLSVGIAVGIMLLGLAVFQLFPSQLLGMFNANAEMLAIGIPALRIISLSFIFAGYCIIIGSVLQAFGHGFVSLLVSFVRQLVVLLPCAYLFSLAGNVDLVWFAFPIAEIASVSVTTIGFVNLWKKVICKIEL